MNTIITSILLLFSLILNADTVISKEKYIIYKPEHKAYSQSNHDLYRLVYTANNKNCTLFKNNQKIEIFDLRFNAPQPHSPYTCATWQKEFYRSCKIRDKKAVSAVALAYGSFARTSLLLGFQADYYRLNASLELECIK